MITKKFEDIESWKSWRIGKITGTRLKDIISKRNNEKKKIGFYELIAERLGIPADTEPPMERGLRLQNEAIEKFMETTGKKVNTNLIGWEREDDEEIAISPDGEVGKTEAVEIKVLSSARHLEALLTQKIPDEYEYQAKQYFVVNDKLQTLYFVFYDPRLLAKPFFYLTIHRKDIEEEVKTLLEYQRSVLAEAREIIKRFSSF